MSRWNLIIDLHGWWQPGTGVGFAAHLDEVAHRDAQGLPELPGRTVKGLLRDAVRRAGQLGWCDTELATRLFGLRDTEGDGRTEPGCLRVGSARLPKAERDWLAGQDGREARGELFSEISSTAIDGDTGTAADHSLRGIEVVLPVRLQARIGLIPGQSAPEGWESALKLALPLVRAVGSGRSRGLGKATLTLEKAS